MTTCLASTLPWLLLPVAAAAAAAATAAVALRRLRGRQRPRRVPHPKRFKRLPRLAPTATASRPRTDGSLSRRPRRCRLAGRRCRPVASVASAWWPPPSPQPAPILPRARAARPPSQGRPPPPPPQQQPAHRCDPHPCRQCPRVASSGHAAPTRCLRPHRQPVDPSQWWAPHLLPRSLRLHLRPRRRLRWLADRSAAVSAAALRGDAASSSRPGRALRSTRSSPRRAAQASMWRARLVPSSPPRPPPPLQRLRASSQVVAGGRRAAPARSVRRITSAQRAPLAAPAVEERSRRPVTWPSMRWAARMPTTSPPCDDENRDRSF